MSDRYYDRAEFEHCFKYGSEDKLRSQLLEFAKRIFDKNMQNLRNGSPDSSMTVYTGLFGRLNALMAIFLRIWDQTHSHYSSDDWSTNSSPEKPELEMKFCNINFSQVDINYLLKVIYSEAPAHQSKIGAYWGTDSGILVQRLMAEAGMPNYDKFLNEFLNLVELSLLSQTQETVYELFLGQAGLLCVLLMIHHLSRIDGVTFERMQKIATTLSNSILAGATENVQPLGRSWDWHGKTYLGPIHGVAGIYSALIVSHQTFQLKNFNISEIIRDFQSLLSSFVIDGNHKSQAESGNADLVQFCHGEPGIDICILEIEQIFPGLLPATFIEYAKKSADLVWERGILRKGMGLCHGISGNGYVFLLLFRLTKNKMYLQRAISYALIIMQRDDPKIGGKFRQPDHPFSLMEGDAGVLRFLFDVFMALDEKGNFDGNLYQIHFPGFFYL